MTWFNLADISVFTGRKIALMSPSRFQHCMSSSGVLLLHKFVFLCRILCDGLSKKALWAMHHPFKSWTRCQASQVFGRRQWRQETSFLLSEISKPKRHSINYSPSLHQSDILIMTGGGYRVSVRLQSRHDRGSNSNMFAAKKYGPLWCVSCLQGIRINSNNSSEENAAYFTSHSPRRKDKEITGLIILWMTLMVILFLLKIGSTWLIIG